MSYHQPGQAQVDSRALRPKVWLYFLAAGIAIVTIAVAILSAVVSQLNAPKLEELGIGVRTMEMKVGEPKWIYVSQPKQLTPPPCQPVGTGEVNVEPLTNLPSVTYDDTKWYAIAKVSVSQDGTYGLACTSAPGGIRVAAGGEPQSAGLFGSLALKVVLPVLGVIAGLVIAIFTFIGRRSHRAKLAAGGDPMAGYGYPQDSGYLDPTYDSQSGYTDPTWGAGQGYGGGYSDPGYGDQGYGDQGFGAPPDYGSQPGYGQQGYPGQEPPTRYWGQ